MIWTSVVSQMGHPKHLEWDWDDGDGLVQKMKCEERLGQEMQSEMARWMQKMRGRLCYGKANHCEHGEKQRGTGLEKRELQMHWGSERRKSSAWVEVRWLVLAWG